MRRGVRAQLKHLNPSGRFPSGNVRFYYRPKGHRGIAMPDLPPDDPAFLNAYAKAAGVRPQHPSREGSIASGVELYKASDQFRALAQGTRDARRRMLDDVAERYGHASRCDLAPKHITKDLSGFCAHPETTGSRCGAGSANGWSNTTTFLVTQAMGSRSPPPRRATGTYLGPTTRSKRSAPTGLWAASSASPSS